MEFKEGDLVTRNSYNNDMVFKILSIVDNNCYLKGINVRLIADSPTDDLVIYSDEIKEDSEFLERIKPKLDLDRSEFFYLPGKILHIDGDSEYLDKCLKYYEEDSLMAIGIRENEKLIISAGACQSNYEELIKAGANFASSPKRINIHALDPAIIATRVSLSDISKDIDLINILENTKYGKDGIGGIKTKGTMYIGYPR